MPAETAAIGQVILKADSPYRLIGDKLFGQFSEEEFADLYSPEGKPGALTSHIGLCDRLSIYGETARPTSGGIAAHAD